MKLFTTLFFTLFLSAISAQPILLNGSGIVPPGSSYPVALSFMSDLGSIGTAQTWDFSSNSFSNFGNLNIISLEESSFANDFPTANWIFTYGSWTSYFEISDTEMNNLALNISVLGDAGDYSENPRKVLQFPFNYLDSYTDEYSENGNVKELTVTYEAYGTLIMPEGYTYTNVIRVREEELGGIITRYWIQEPFMNIALHNSDNNYFTWIKVSPANTMDEKELSLVKLFPNPTKDHLLVESEEAYTFSIADLSGKIIQTGSNVAGKHSVNINLLSNGMYVFNFTTKSQSESIRFVKE